MAKDKKTTKQVKKPKRIRQNWQELQKEFDLYKIKHRNKTLEDFCNLKNVNYNMASKRIKVGKSVKKAQIYDIEKAAEFTETVKKKGLKPEKRKVLSSSKRKPSLIRSYQKSMTQSN